MSSSTGLFFRVFFHSFECPPLVFSHCSLSPSDSQCAEAEPLHIESIDSIDVGEGVG